MGTLATNGLMSLMFDVYIRNFISSHQEPVSLGLNIDLAPFIVFL